MAPSTHPPSEARLAALRSLSWQNFENDGAPFYAIISTASKREQLHWQRYLSFLPDRTPWMHFIVVAEEWPNGAGNGLGTLYAFQQAYRALKQAYDVDLKEELASGARVALYHTAGLGQRLYPLPLSEFGTKSAIKIPSRASSANSPFETLFEATLRQTLPIVSALPGHFFVFWADQIFHPTVEIPAPHAHCAVFCQRQEPPMLASWHTAHWDQYGVFGRNAKGAPQLYEKLSEATLQQLSTELNNPFASFFAKSMGSFCISLPLMQALIDEFHLELRLKSAKLDTDTHFWMPLMHDAPTYARLLEEKGIAHSISYAHHERMARVTRQLSPSIPLFSLLDIGKEASYWDFGTLRTYAKLLMEMTQPSDEGALLRAFFNHEATWNPANRSIVDDSTLHNASLQDSLVCGVTAHSLEAKSSILIGSHFHTLSSSSALAYNVTDNAALILAPDQVMVDLLLLAEQERLRFRDTISNNPKSDWHLVLPSNPCSYADAALMVTT